MADILVIDDDVQVLGTVRRVLSREAHNILAFTSGEQALSHAVQHPPDLIILDIVMPGIDGLTLCQELRAARATAAIPILFLTVRSGAEELAQALDCGGDDCLRKPFAAKELSARVRALLRRAFRAQRPRNDAAEAGSVRSVYMPPGTTLRVLPEERAVQVGARTVELTATELHLLQYLAQRPGALFPAERLLEEVWRYPAGTGDPALVRTHVRNLRRKIETDPARPTILLSLHGRGYTLNIVPAE